MGVLDVQGAATTCRLCGWECLLSELAGAASRWTSTPCTQAQPTARCKICIILPSAADCWDITPGVEAQGKEEGT